MIEVYHVTKKYGSFKAVDDLSLTAHNGRITILLGPNGAGKSTTIKSIAGLLKFDGKILIDGFPNSSIDAKRRFGYIPETPVLYEQLTIREHIQFISRAYQAEAGEARAQALLERLELADKAKKNGSRIIQRDVAEAVDGVGVIGGSGFDPDRRTDDRTRSGGDRNGAAAAERAARRRQKHSDFHAYHRHVRVAVG